MGVATHRLLCVRRRAGCAHPPSRRSNDIAARAWAARIGQTGRGPIEKITRLSFVLISLPDGTVSCVLPLGFRFCLSLINVASNVVRTMSIFAGPPYGAPLKVGGKDLIEGSNIVEVTDGHLRIVVGDPAYGGWTWSYKGPWHRGWDKWWGKWGGHRYAETWHQKLTRVVDPGFHSLRLNSLEIERVPAPAQQSSVFFRDFFNRDDSSDINAGLAKADHWIRVPLHPSDSDGLSFELYKTSLKLVGPKHGKGVIGLVQQKPSPAKGIVRYSTRVSLFTGEGSRIHSGIQEAGLLILGEPTRTDGV